MTRESGRLLREHNRYPTTPQQRPPRRSGIVRSPTNQSGLSAYVPGKVVNDVGFAAIMKRGAIMGMLMQEMSRLARLAGGSNKTVHDRMALAQRFSERLVVAQNIQFRQVAQLKARHIEDYIRERLQQGIARRSLQNEMAAIRSLLVQAGRNKLAVSERISNRALGLSGAPSTGTHRAIPPEYHRQVLDTARAKDAGLAATLELSRLMGLRSLEAVQIAQSLKTWRQAIERGEPRFTVVLRTLL